MAWADVEWSNGDTPTETKGDQMQANLDYIREVLRGQTVAQEACNVESSAMSTSDWNLRVNVGPLEWTSDLIASTTFAEVNGLRNKDISSLTTGVAYLLTITAVGNSQQQQLLATTYIAHDDGNYLTICGKVRAADPGTPLASIMGYTALVTRDNEGF